MFNTLNFRKILLFTVDVLLLYLSLLVALFLNYFENFHWIIFKKHFLPFTILYSIWLIVFYVTGIYDLFLLKTTSLFYKRLLIALIVNLIFGFIFFYLTPFFGISPKTNLILNVIIFGIFILGWRKIFSSFFSFYFQNRVAVIGNNPQVEELIKIIQKNPTLGYKFLGFLEPNENIAEKLKNKRIDTLILAEKFESNSLLIKNLYQCLHLKLNFIDLAQAYEIIAEKIPISFISLIWFLENLKEREKSFYEKFKRVLDFSLAFFLFLGTLPLWLLIALSIKFEDKGPVFYFQERIGKNKKSFLLMKFRSMHIDAEKETGAVWAEKEDKRVTKVGNFLRKTHLDELPQLINILKGDISLVGPRPERPEFVAQLEKEIPHYHLRHIIKPGFTGWAQIKFRYARTIMDSLEKFQYDLYYLKNRSFLLDLKILLSTFQLFFKRE